MRVILSQGENQYSLEQTLGTSGKRPRTPAKVHILDQRQYVLIEFLSDPVGNVVSSEKHDESEKTVVGHVL